MITRYFAGTPKQIIAELTKQPHKVGLYREVDSGAPYEA